MIEYKLVSEDGTQGVGEIKVESDEDPHLTEDEYEEIIQVCLEDSLKQEDIKEEPAPEESYKMIEKFDFGKN